ncbi:MAG: hypothetical protein ACRDHW_03600, partial [Ktedonobacteraceae bacterium]
MSISDLTSAVQPCTSFILPDWLTRHPHFVVWKREPRKDGTTAKAPYIARAALSGKHYRASVKKPQNWSTYAQACRAYEQGGFDGIGYVLTGGIIFVDLDHCINERGEIDPRAQEILDLLRSPAERSPSGDGIHACVKGDLPPGCANRLLYKGLKIEIYSQGRYMTLTGAQLDESPISLETRTAEMATFLQACEQRPEDENTVVCGGGGAGIDSQEPQAVRASTQAGMKRQPPTDQAPAKHRQDAGLVDSQGQIRENDLSRVEQLALLKARSARNGADFQTLWQGGDPRSRTKADGSPDTSAADFDLILILLYWTNDHREQTAHLFRASERYRSEKGAGRSAGQAVSYLERTIDKALTRRQYGKTRKPKPEKPPEGPGAGPRQPAVERQPAHQDRRIIHEPHASRREETPEQRTEILQEAARRVAEEVDRHIRADRRDVIHIAAVPPGVGKTHSVSELGLPERGLKVSWVAERRDMASQVPALQQYRMIEPCTHANCDGSILHNMLGSKSRNTMAVHMRHRVPCGYRRQFDGNDSAIFQLAHVRAKQICNADGVIIDELDLGKWLPEREISLRLLMSALKPYPTGSIADKLIRAIEATITDCMQAKEQMHGRALFEALNQRCYKQLYNWIVSLGLDKNHDYRDTHPWTTLDEDDDMAQ